MIYSWEEISWRLLAWSKKQMELLFYLFTEHKFLAIYFSKVQFSAGSIHMCDYNLHSLLKQECVFINLAKHVLEVCPSIQEFEITLKTLFSSMTLKVGTKTKLWEKQIFIGSMRKYLNILSVIPIVKFSHWLAHWVELADFQLSWVSDQSGS